MAGAAARFAPDARTRVFWVVAIVVAGLAAWLLDRPHADPAAASSPDAAGTPADPGDYAEVDIIWDGPPDTLTPSSP